MLALVTTLAATAAIAISPAPVTAQSSALDPGLTQQLSSQIVEGSTSYNLIHRSFPHAGINREYHIALPAFFDRSRSYPVVIGFGGRDHTATQLREYAGLERVARGNAIIIYAQGVNNTWAGAPYSSTTMSQDIEYARTAINDVINNYSGDPDRVWATGMSNGGGMATALGCHAPGLVDAVASVAGAYYNPTITGCGAGQIPMLFMHSTDDNVVSYWGGTRHGAPYNSTYSTFESFAWRNGCTTAFVHQTHEYPGTTTFRPGYCSSRTEMVRVDSGGHTWFEQPPAEDLVWNFFHRHG